MEAKIMCSLDPTRKCVCCELCGDGVEDESEEQDLTPEEARIRYYESQADIAREEADDGE